MLFQVVLSVLLSMVALITTYMKESDWLLKNFHQSENGLQSYHGEQNQGYHLKEHKKLYWKLVLKVMLHFVWGHLSRKQTVLSSSERGLQLLRRLFHGFFLPFSNWRQHSLNGG